MSLVVYLSWLWRATLLTWTPFFGFSHVYMLLFIHFYDSALLSQKKQSVILMKSNPSTKNALSNKCDFHHRFFFIKQICKYVSYVLIAFFALFPSISLYIFRVWKEIRFWSLCVLFCWKWNLIKGWNIERFRDSSRL